MMSRTCTPLVLLVILLSNAISIHAETETREQTKQKLCEEAHGKCTSSLSLLESIAGETNSEAMRLKYTKENLAFDIRDINRQIEVLRRRIANPSTPVVEEELLGRSGVGIPEVNFVYPAFINCTSLNECLGTMAGIKSYWKELEDMKTSFNSEIITLQSEKTRLENLRESLKQQLANILQN